MNTHIYLTYIKQRWRQNKFYGSSSLNLICSWNAERKPLNIAIKLEAPSGDCYNDVTIETDPGVFLTLGGATICRGSELQPSVQVGIPNDHIHYSVWDYYICIHFFPFSRPFFPISHSNNMHKQILVYILHLFILKSLWIFRAQSHKGFLAGFFFLFPGIPHRERKKIWAPNWRLRYLRKLC